MNKLDTEKTLDEDQAVSQNQNSETIDNPNKENMTKKSKKILLIISLLAIIAGTATGFGGYKLQNKTSASDQSLSDTSNKNPIERVAEGTVKKGDTFGINDPDTFKDTATGYLKKGGIDGEGSHQLLREGGASRTVYLTSSVTDLDKLTGMEIKVWGETNKGQKAAWLMDVGLVEVLNTDAGPPFEEQL